eukprot:gene833-9082_t
MLKTILKYKKTSLFSATFVTGASFFSINQQSTPEKHIEAERKLFEKYVKTTKFEQKFIKLYNGYEINTIISQPETKKPPLVLVHGWGSGLALWSKNLDDLSEHYQVYALDLLGFGRSSRPKFIGKTPEDAKDFWLNSFDEWRKEVGLEKFTLLGHSLGGFLTCSYALEKPQHLEKLILAAPIGIAPWKIQLETPFRKFLASLIWGPLQITPQSLLRGMGPFGYNFWSNIGERARYRELDKEGWEYLYHNQVGLKSGDHAFMKLLTKEGFGYPLFDKLKMMKVPTRIIFGEQDYVRPDIGPSAIAQIPVKSDFVVIRDIGHHMYFLKNKEFLNSIIGFQ